MMNHIIILFVFILSLTINCFGEEDYASIASCSSATAGPCQQLAQDLISNSTFISQVQSAITAVQAAEAVVIAPTCLPGNSAQITTHLQSIIKSQEICSKGSTYAEVLCSLSSNPKIQAGMTVMNGLAGTLLNTSSAKDTCSSTSKAAFAAQALVAAGAAFCGTAKSKCEADCALSAADIEKLSAAAMASGPQCVPAQAITSMSKLKTVEKKAKVAKCEAFAPNLAQMVQIGMGLLQNAQQAKTCAAQLAGNATEDQSIEAMCANPANSNNSVCTCRLNPAAQGCPGYMATLKNEGNIKLPTTNGPSNLAGFGTTKPAAKPGLGGLGDISDEAKEILAKNGEVPNNSDMFGAAAGAAAGGGGSTGSGPNADKGGAKPAEEGKSLANTFSSALNSLKGSIFGGGSNRGSADKLQGDRYKQAQRQLAAEQLRSEVSGASGLDNFAKITKRYKSNWITLIDGN